MNAIITKRFNAIEETLLQSEIVSSFLLIRKEITQLSGKIRLKVFFTDGNVAEFFEYVTVENNAVRLEKYSFHWQAATGELKSRWDNAPHHPELPNAPHHKHNADLSVMGVSENIDIFYVLNSIKQAMEI
jgi:hypothetical protein